MKVTVTIDEEKVKGKVTNDRFGLFASQEWKRLIDPYTPRDTGAMQDTAQIRPFEIEYIQPYSARQYYGYDFNFQTNNPYSTFEWDKAAARAGQQEKLYRTLNAGLENGNF